MTRAFSVAMTLLIAQRRETGALRLLDGYSIEWIEESFVWGTGDDAAVYRGELFDQAATAHDVVVTCWTELYDIDQERARSLAGGAA